MLLSKQGEIMNSPTNRAMTNLLDCILLSKDVVSKFHDEYKNNSVFKRWIDENIPEVSLCEKQEQKTPWHIYNVLDHILHSVDNMNKLASHLEYSDRRMLVYTMFFHDIGKPYAHSYDKNRKRDRFFDHNIKSEAIAKDVLPKLGFSLEERRIIQALIFKHDIFMFIKVHPVSNPYWKQLSENLIKKEVEELDNVGDGYKLLKFLIMVGKADSLAQNPQMATLEVHEKMEKMLFKVQSEKEENITE